MLTESQLAVIKQTVPVLQENGELLTRHFYQRMFRENPEVQAFFNPAHQHAGTQQKALASAICAYAENIDNLEALGQAVELIAHKHASLGIQAEHYPIVGSNLLASIKEVLGDAATDEIIDAWAAAYGVLAEIFISREGQIYQQHQSQYGWEGFKSFRVQKREKASDNIVSFYLRPEDGSSLQAHLPGQYITVRVTPGQGDPIMRNYSLSNRPGDDFYRISVKREEAVEEGAPDGVCSVYLHEHLAEGDLIELAPPCGEFVLKEQNEGEVASLPPLVFIAGGVGITPVLSMLHAALAQQPGRRIIFIQCAINGNLRPFADEVRQLDQEYHNLTTHVRLSDPVESDRKQGEYDSEGLVDDALLDQLVGDTAAEFYLCGPTPMLKHLWHLLAQRGVDPEQVYFEFFGPAGDLAA